MPCSGARGQARRGRRDAPVLLQRISETHDFSFVSDSSPCKLSQNSHCSVVMLTAHATFGLRPSGTHQWKALHVTDAGHALAMVAIFEGTIPWIEARSLASVLSRAGYLRMSRQRLALLRVYDLVPVINARLNTCTYDCLSTTSRTRLFPGSTFRSTHRRTRTARNSRVYSGG